MKFLWSHKVVPQVRKALQAVGALSQPEHLTLCYEGAIQPFLPTSARMLQPFTHDQGENLPRMLQEDKAEWEPGSHIFGRILQEKE